VSELNTSESMLPEPHNRRVGTVG